MTSHPTYARPAVVDALCEIHFGLPEGRSWGQSRVDSFHERVREQYPDVETVQGLAVELNLAPDGVQQRSAVQGQRHRFRHRERPVVLQVRDGVFTVNVLEPYPGWASVKQTVGESWAAGVSVFEPSAILRIGLRYINRIGRRSANDRVGDWLMAGDYLPAGVLGSQHGFMSRVVADLGLGNRLIVMLGEGSAEEMGSYGSIFFDIDRIGFTRRSGTFSPPQ